MYQNAQPKENFTNKKLLLKIQRVSFCMGTLVASWLFCCTTIRRRKFLKKDDAGGHVHGDRYKSPSISKRDSDTAYENFIRFV
jgi:hypothetical protein